MNKNGNWIETEAGKQIQERLSNEKTLQALDHILARLDTIEKAVEQLNNIMRQGPGLVAMVGDMADEAYRKADERGISIDDRLKTSLELAEKLTAPETVQKLEQLVELSNKMPGMVSMMADILDEGMEKANERGFNPQMLAEIAGKANTALTKAYYEHPEKVGGIFSLLRAIKDPDRQKAIGFLLNFTKYWGQSM